MSTQSVCRLCTVEIVGGHDISTKIQNQINKLLPVLVMQWDPLPRTICDSCLIKLDLFDQFYNSTARAEEYLRKQCKLLDEFKTTVITDFKIEPFTYGHHIKHLVSHVPAHVVLDENDEIIIVKPTNSELIEVIESDLSDNDISIVEESINRTNRVENDEVKIPNFNITKISKDQNMYICKLCSKTYTAENPARSHVCKTSNDTDSLNSSSTENAEQFICIT